MSTGSAKINCLSCLRRLIYGVHYPDALYRLEREDLRVLVVEHRVDYILNHRRVTGDEHRILLLGDAVSSAVLFEHLLLFLILVLRVLQSPALQNVGVSLDRSSGAVELYVGADTRISAGRADKCRDGARLEGYHRRRQILRLYLVLVYTHCGMHARDVAHQPLHEVDRVNSLIHKRTAAVHSPRSVPAVVVVVLVAVPLDGEGSENLLSETS